MKTSNVAWFWFGYIVNWMIILFVIILTFGCTGDYEKGWAWGVITPEGEIITEKFLWDRVEVRVDNVEKTEYGDDILIPVLDRHKLCQAKHYIDPYTKNEYCLPENFTNIEQLHIYQVRKK